MPVLRPRWTNRALMTAAAVGLTLGLTVTTARAGIPELEINWSINDGPLNQLTPPGSDNGDGTFNYQGSDVDVSGIVLNWNLNGDPDPLISGNFALQNTLNNTINVFIQLIFPISVAFPNGTQIGGSAAVGLTTDSGGGTLSTIGGESLWQALIDGAVVGEPAALFDDPFSLSLGGLGSIGDSESFGLPNLVAGPPANASIGIEINFSLTSLDQASITSVFVVVPGPGAAALLALGGLVGTRRRRRA